MMKRIYRYPEGLGRKFSFLLWSLRDWLILAVASPLAVVLAVAFRSLVPPVPVFLYAICWMQVEGQSIGGYLKKALRYLWRDTGVFVPGKDSYETKKVITKSTRLCSHKTRRT